MKENNHMCSSRCRRDGCPLCPHGVDEGNYCDVCDFIPPTAAVKKEITLRKGTDKATAIHNTRLLLD